MDINQRLNAHLDKAKLKSPLFADLKSHTYLLKPNHLIMKPLFAVLILQNKFYTHKQLNELVKGTFDFLDWNDHLQLVWRNKKHLLKEKNFTNKLYDFDVRNVRKDQMDLLERLYENDRWMTYTLISRESQISGHMFLWTQQIFEFIQVAEHMGKIGIKDLEDKILLTQQREKVTRNLIERRNVKSIDEKKR